MLKLEDYLRQREALKANAPRTRELCRSCRQPGFACYCPELRPFHSDIHFAILIHPIESRRRIATGRMSHLTLQNSSLIEGQDYRQNAKVNALLEDPANDCRILYPGPRATDLGAMPAEERRQTLTPAPNRRLVIFVIDGTWATARKMMRQSENLAPLPRLAFTPARPSNFRVRKQPRPECFSTLEAIHQLLEFSAPERPEHAGLLQVFDHMVEKQLNFIRASHLSTRKVTYRREENRKVLAGLGLLEGEEAPQNGPGLGFAEP